MKPPVHVEITLKDVSGRVTKRWRKRFEDTREVRKYFMGLIYKYSATRTLELRYLPDSLVRLRPWRHQLGNRPRKR